MDQYWVGFIPVLVCIAFALLACFLVSRFLCRGLICGMGGGKRRR